MMHTHMHNRRAILVLVSAALFAVTLPAQVRMTREQALKASFGEATIVRKTAFLTNEQVDAIQRAARAKVESKLVTYYVATTDRGAIGTAFLETMTVRTMPATFIIVVGPDTSIRSVEILAFHEPEDYMPSEQWMAQFGGKTQVDDLFLKRGIHAIAGATLSAQAISDAVRRVLATYAIVVAAEDVR